MERSGGVTAAGVVLLVGSTVLLLIALAAAIAIPHIASKASAAPYPPGAFAAAIIFYLALACWGVGTAVGLSRLRPWARISILSMSVLALVIGFISVVSVLILLPHMPDQQDAHTMAAVRGILVVSFGFPMAIAAWWLVLFLRPGVRQQFSSTAGATVVATPFVRPVSITVIAVFLLLGVPGMLWVLYLMFPTRATGIPTMVLGVLVSGWGATAFNVAALAANLALGLGLWRMKPWARTGAIAYLSFSIVNLAAMALRPDNFSRIITAMRTANPALASYPLPRDFLWFIAALSTGLAVAALWFLIKRKGRLRIIDICINNAIDWPPGGSSYAPTEGQCRSAGGSPPTSLGLVRYGLVSERSGTSNPMCRQFGAALAPGEAEQTPCGSALRQGAR